MNDDNIVTEEYNEGYNKGHDAGRERAWILLDKVGEYYKSVWKGSDAIVTMAENKGKWEAILYAQQVIKRDFV